MIDRSTFAKQLYRALIPSNMPSEEQEKILGSLQDTVYEMLPKSLYRYRTCSEHHISAFDRDELWVTTADCMNDGYDTRIYVDQNVVNKQIENLTANNDEIVGQFINISDLSFLPPQFKQAHEQMSKLTDVEIKDEINNFVRWLKDDFSGALLKVVEAGQKTAKFCCFSESIRSSYMWGIYSLNESGFALEYDFTTQPYVESSTPGHTRNSVLYPVIYSEQRYRVSAEYIVHLLKYRLAVISLINSGISNTNPEYARQFLSSIICPDNLLVTKISLHKSIEWQQEAEWRLFCTSDDIAFQNEKFGCCIKKPKALYLGRRISEINEKILRKIADEKSIPVYKMAMDDNSPTYELEIK